MTVTEAYRRADLPPERRAADLLSRMTAAEKVGQMTQVDRRFLRDETDIARYGLGSLFSGGGSAPPVNTPASWLEMVRGFRSLALESRLRIPLLYGIDAVHGHNNVRGAVIFPHNIGLGCSGDPALVRAVGRAVATEVAATGIHWNFAPCAALALDPRWGRTYESFASDPQLTARLVRAFVEGYLERQPNLACVKHFIGDGGTTGGRDQGDTQIDEAGLRRLHLPPFRAAIAAGVGSVMASFSSWNGRKVHGHRYLLTDLLKGELGFTGIVVSDDRGVDQVADDYRQAVKLSVNAGIDMVMVPDRYPEFIAILLDLLECGAVPPERIDDAVRRILTVKFRLGLFDEPAVPPVAAVAIDYRQQRELARRCVRESLVLLHDPAGTLPLAKNLSRLHVSGKNAHDLGHQCGGWTIAWQGGNGPLTDGTTILEGIRAALAPDTEVSFSPDGSGAEGAAVAVAVIGETPYAEGQGDRSDLALAPEDRQVIANLRRSGAPVVVVLVTGRPLDLTPVLPDCAAVLCVWLPGSEGQGVADVLFGDYAPTGRLARPWPGEERFRL